jgi:hypothetical protein
MTSEATSWRMNWDCIDEIILNWEVYSVSSSQQDVCPHSQAMYIDQYKNTKRKVLTCNENIFLNPE